MPMTRSRASTTARTSSSRPILAVPTGWKIVVPILPAAPIRPASSSSRTESPGRYSTGEYFCRAGWRTILRALFPKRILASPSLDADIGWFFFGIFLYGILFGWAVLSYQYLSNVVIGQMVATFGAVQPTTLPGWLSRSIMTVVAFLAFELGYWFHHYLSHRIPFMWEFHKVHHTAEVLTPITLFHCRRNPPPVSGKRNNRMSAGAFTYSNVTETV